MFHYKACGLPNVYLENGYTIQQTEHGEAFSISNIEQLHDAIGMAVIAKPDHLTGDEVRFLRTELSMSMKALGKLLGYKYETIKSWESGKSDIQKSSDVLLRALYSEYHNEASKVQSLVHSINNLEKEMSQMLRFKRQDNDGWVVDEEARAA